MTNDKSYTILQLTEKKRDDLVAEGSTEDELNTLHDGFTNVLHDCICGDENIAFTVVATPDGPLVDWHVHTEEEWTQIIKVHQAKKVAQDLLRKLFGG